MRCTGHTASSAAGAVAIVAGIYEFTPLKQHFRRRCRESVHSGFVFGLYCVGSSIGLMVMLVALSAMSVTWMCVIAVLVLAQKLLPAKAAIDVPLALAIVGLGILIVVAPSSVPELNSQVQDRGSLVLPDPQRDFRQVDIVGTQENTSRNRKPR